LEYLSLCVSHCFCMCAMSLSWIKCNDFGPSKRHEKCVKSLEKLRPGLLREKSSMIFWISGFRIEGPLYKWIIIMIILLIFSESTYHLSLKLNIFSFGICKYWTNINFENVDFNLWLLKISMSKICFIILIIGSNLLKKFPQHQLEVNYS